jgi:hypothetical protein
LNEYFEQCYNEYNDAEKCCADSWRALVEGVNTTRERRWKTEFGRRFHQEVLLVLMSLQTTYAAVVFR